MSQRVPTWTIDPRDPRAPSPEIWDAMSAAERRAIVDALPTALPEEFTPPPEGDRLEGVVDELVQRRADALAEIERLKAERG